MSNIKIACSTVAFRLLSLDRALEIIRGAGFTRIETQSKGAWCPHVDIDKDDPILFADRVKSFGIDEIAALHMFEGCVLNSETFVSYTQRAAKWAKAAGVPVLITSEGCILEGMTDAEAQAILQGRLSEAAGYAAEQGVSLAIETRARQTKTLTEDLLQPMNAWKGKELGINFDTANVHACEVDEAAILQSVMERVIHCHAKDTHAGHCTALGKGDVNIDACFDVLKKAGYEGYVVLETEGDEPVEIMERMVKESYEKMVGCFGR